jgi:hypothetical protein
VLRAGSLEVAEDGGRPVLVSSRIAPPALFREAGFRMILEGSNPDRDLVCRASYPDGEGTRRRLRRVRPTRYGGRRP